MNNNMDQKDPTEIPEEILEQAASWQARLRDADPSSHEARQLNAEVSAWLLADPLRRRAYAEMKLLWEALDAPVRKIIEEQPTHETSIVQTATPGNSKPMRSSYSRPWYRFASAACLVLALLAGIGGQQDWVTQWQSDYITAVGEQTPINTDDGSRITLNTDSALAMDYSAQERRVRLLKGEAWFEVASGDKRPFIVSTDAGAVRVTGTQFNVRLVDDAAIVSLDEGGVELRLPATGNNSADDFPVTLTPGQQAVLSGNGISAPGSFDRTAVTAWLRGQFVFYNTPLAEVVDTLNRHRHGRIVVTSRELNRLKVSGIFATDDPDAALDVIASTLPIQQTRLTDYLVLIR